MGNQIREDYFEWLYNLMCEGRANDKVSFRKLFMFLHRIDFTYTIPNDANRAADGIDLRYKYAMEMNDPEIFDILHGPCSVLEMMIGLAIRCEKTIMDDTRYGDRTSQWFWNMMSNLGIGLMTDDIYDIRILGDIICDFLDRNYEPDGRGGLFYIRGYEGDLRDKEIWTQLCHYLTHYNY